MKLNHAQVLSLKVRFGTPLMVAQAIGKAIDDGEDICVLKLEELMRTTPKDVATLTVYTASKAKLLSMGSTASPLKYEELRLTALGLNYLLALHERELSAMHMLFESLTDIQDRMDLDKTNSHLHVAKAA